MPSIMTLAGPRGLKSPRKAKKSGSKLPPGACKRITNGRTGRAVCLCHTGKGRSGYQFKKLGSSGC